MEIHFRPSPNHDSRKGVAIDMLVLHYTGMVSGTAALERLCDPSAPVSAHYVVEEDGRIFQLVEESERAWHAGVSNWRGEKNINARSIGIEIVNPGHEFGYRVFPKPQMESVILLCREIVKRHSIPARNVVAHSDVAPERKEDPGELFDWAWLAREGVGVWPSLVMPTPLGIQAPSISDHNTEKTLTTYGYSFGNGTPEAIRKTILAFQRHFRPRKLTGEWDAECQSLLGALLAKL